MPVTLKLGDHIPISQQAGDVFSAQMSEGYFSLVLAIFTAHGVSSVHPTPEPAGSLSVSRACWGQPSRCQGKTFTSLLHSHTLTKGKLETPINL